MLLTSTLLLVLAASARAGCTPALDGGNVRASGYLLPPQPLPYSGFLDRRYIFSTLQTLVFQIQELQRQQLLLLTALRCAKVPVLPNEACINPTFEPLPTTSPTTSTESATTTPTTTTTTTTTTVNPPEFSNEGENTAEAYPSLYDHNKEYDLFVPPEVSGSSGLLQGNIDIKLPSFDIFGRMGKNIITQGAPNQAHNSASNADVNEEVDNSEPNPQPHV